ncbi:DnaJ domain [Macleaya cordata]|uniref:DnaJ domain n=1 Tax=Macleaya cordata TaxID=56857 RepID=A0A200PTH7_MACCD|nr:DnaJ domain [Macleaya cordata]
MASTTATAPPAFSLLLKEGRRGSVESERIRTTRLTSRLKHRVRGGGVVVRVYASEGELGSSKNSSQQQQEGKSRAPPGVDTRIHWDNPDEGWLGGTSTSTPNSSEPLKDKDEKVFDSEEPESFLGQEFSDLLNNASNDSHYQFLGISAEADLEEIKAAYRRLSKEYHPDTTLLPLKAASDKFMKLREIYDVLSNEDTRRFYDWTLAQEAASRKAEKMRMKLEDPYEQEVKNWEPVPDMVDRLGGKNMELSDQAMTALTIDGAILIFAICCIIYVVFFKEPY